MFKVKDVQPECAAVGSVFVERPAPSGFVLFNPVLWKRENGDPAAIADFFSSDDFASEFMEGMSGSLHGAPQHESSGQLDSSISVLA